jgi:hypothetical protein
VPANSPQGALSIIGVGGTSGLSQINSYYVVPFTPTLTPASSPNTPGSTVTVNGTGFAPGETVNFILEGTTAGSVTANSSGSFTGASFVVPNVSIGTHLLHGTGAASGADAIYYFYVGGFYPSSYPSTYYLLPGEQISFGGSGFGAGETVNVYFESDSTPDASLVANNAGEFTNAGTFTIPLSTSGGIKTFRLKGATTGVEASPIMITVGEFNALVNPSGFWIAPGGTLEFSGTGFASGETIQLFLGSSTTPLTTFSASAAGTFENVGDTVIPYSFAGMEKVFRLRGTLSGTEDEVSIMVGGLYPALNPSAWWLLPGQNFSVSGTGFGPGEQVTVTMNGTTSVNVAADSSGGFENAGPFQVPFSGTSVVMTAVGQSSGASPSSPLSISKGALSPLITPTSYYVQSGSSLGFTGMGFAPGETITLSNGLTTLGTATADSFGNFPTTTITTTFGLDRDETYNFSGNASGAVGSITVRVAKLNPNAEADAYYVTPGSSVNVKGTGFASGETVNISVGASTASAVANSMGDIPFTSITIPVSMSGTASVVLTGATSGVSANVNISLAPFQAQVDPSTYWTFPGTAVNFSGTGFTTGETVSITLNGSPVGTATTTSGGLFTASGITIPYSGTTANFVFTGNTSGATDSVNIALGTLNPGIWLSTYYDKGGTPLTVFGGGFGSNETVTVTFEGATLGTATTNNSGSFELVTTVPFGPAGDKTIQARGNSSGVSSSLINFTQPQVYVGVTLGSYAGAPGDAINFVGVGFLPNEPIEITTSRTGSTVVHTFSANAAGEFSNSGLLAPAPGGPLTLTIRGTHSFTTKSISYYVTGP